MRKPFVLSLLGAALAGSACLVLSSPRLHGASTKAPAAIWVSPNGNDETGLRGRFDLPFQHAWDVITNDTGYARGACKVARAGDLIVFTPGLHFVASVPLPDKVDLWAMPGAVLVRQDFTNGIAEGTRYAKQANLSTCGPMILPGNYSRIDLRSATCIATNSVYDAVLGWFEILNTRRPFNNYGFDNKPKVNVLVFCGQMIGSSDVIYCTQTNPGRASITIEGGDIYSGWDSIRLHGNVSLVSRNLKVFSTNTVCIASSRGVALSGGARWQDFNSCIGSGGGTNQNLAAHADNASVDLNLTSLFTTGSDGIPLFLANGAKAGGHGIANGMPVWLGGSLARTRGTSQWLVNNPGLRLLLQMDVSTNLSITPIR